MSFVCLSFERITGVYFGLVLRLRLIENNFYQSCNSDMNFNNCTFNWYKLTFAAIWIPWGLSNGKYSCI